LGYFGIDPFDPYPRDPRPTSNLPNLSKPAICPRNMEASIALAANHLLAVELSGKHLGEIRPFFSCP